MNRTLPIVNLLGVLLLSGLCGVQWQANRQVNLEAAALTRIRHEQTARLEEQSRTISGLSSDLDGFRIRLQAASTGAKETEAKLRSLERDVHMLTVERDQLKASLTNWIAAVTARDERLRESAAQIQEVAAGRNAAVARLNDITEKYNALVQDLGEARARLATGSTNGFRTTRTQ